MTKNKMKEFGGGKYMHKQGFYFFIFLFMFLAIPVITAMEFKEPSSFAFAISSSEGGNDVKVSLYGDDLSFMGSRVFPEYNAIYPLSSLEDINGDGQVDLVYSDFTEGIVKVYAGPTFEKEIMSLKGGRPIDGFGSTLDLMDVNHDGYTDIFIGAPNFRENGFSVGKVYVYSGEDGSEIYSIVGPSGKRSFYGGTMRRAGEDMNSDGYEDFIIVEQRGYPESTVSINFYSGKDGSLLFEFPTREDDGVVTGVVDLDDIDDDGKKDYLVSSLVNTTRFVNLYSGRNGSLIYNLSKTESERQTFGVSVSVLGDVDGDGYDDFVTGHSYELGNSAYGKAYIYSGKTGLLIQPITGWSATFGSSVRTVKDLDGDNMKDFIVSDPLFGPGWSGRVYAYSSSTGNLLQELKDQTPERGEVFGMSLGTF